jgi:hypothetical protein
VGDVIDLIKPEILKNSGDLVVAALEALSTDPKVPILAKRRETFFWRYQTVVNHETPTLDAVIEQRKDVQDPDVDFQLAVIGEKQGLTGDALKVDVVKNLLAGKEKLAQTKGLTLFGGPAPAGGGFMGGGAPAKTTVLPGLRGLASFRDDVRWAEVFSRQGIAFVSLDQPAFLFAGQGLSPEGKKLMEGLAKANLLLIFEGLDGAQTKLVLENTGKPVMVHTNAVPDKDVLDLCKKTNSVLGLVLGKDEDASSYFRKIDQAKKAAGTENIAIVTQNSLWDNAGKEQMLKVLSEFLNAKYENQDLANLFSGAFTRALTRARTEVPPRQ